MREQLGEAMSPWESVQQNGEGPVSEPSFRLKPGQVNFPLCVSASHL